MITRALDFAARASLISVISTHQLYFKLSSGFFHPLQLEIYSAVKCLARGCPCGFSSALHVFLEQTILFPFNSLLAITTDHATIISLDVIESNIRAVEMLLNSMRCKH